MVAGNLAPANQDLFDKSDSLLSLEHQVLKSCCMSAQHTAAAFAFNLQPAPLTVHLSPLLTWCKLC